MLGAGAKHVVYNIGHGGQTYTLLVERLRSAHPKSPFVFVSERGAPFSKRGFQAMVERAARAAGFDMKIHPHMLRVLDRLVAQIVLDGARTRGTAV